MRREVQLEAVERVGDDLAYRDDLTGLYNRRLLAELLDRWWAETVEECGRLALIMIDLDGFKRVNDRYGHMVGDRVLRRVSRVLVDSFRTHDVVVRYGGDEMVVVLPGAGAEEASALGDRARDALRLQPLELDGESADPPVELSFSVGVAAFPEDGADGQALLAEADRRLYLDKKDRRGSRRERARRRGRLLRWALAATVAVVTAVVTTLVVLLVTERQGRVTIRAEAEPETAALAADAARREAELEAQIESLRAEIASLSRPRVEDATPGPEAAETSAREEQLAGLRARVTTLEQMLDEAAAVEQPRDEEALPEPVATAVPAGDPTPGPGDVAGAPPAAGTPPEASARASEPPPPPVVKSPVLLRVPSPRYPEWARRFRRYATVRVRVEVAPSGQVTGAEVVGERVGFGFDAAARAAALDAVFEPATVDDTPVAAEATLVIHFDLAGSED